VFVFPHNVSNTDAAKITKLDMEVFQNESWKPMYIVIKSQGHEAQKTIMCRSSDGAQYGRLLHT